MRVDVRVRECQIVCVSEEDKESVYA